MRCGICNGEIHDMGIRVVLPELKWHGETLRGKEVCMCVDCATIFYDDLDATHLFQTGGMPTEPTPIKSDFEFYPSTIPSYTLTDARANTIRHAIINGITKEVEPKEMKAMISQPMANKTNDEIETTYNNAYKHLHKDGYDVTCTVFTEVYEWDCKNHHLHFLARSLEAMSKCDTVYFCKGWENYRGCRIEHEAAKAYGLKIIYEEDK